MGSLSVQQLATLLNLLSKESSEALTLEALCHRLNTNFPKSDAYKVGTALSQFLQFPGNWFSNITFKTSLNKSVFDFHLKMGKCILKETIMLCI